MVIHVVKPGDTVYFIARRYGVPMQTIIDDNGLENPDLIYPGQVLIINGEAPVHTVQRGQSLFSIARNYNIPIAVLLEANRGLNPRRLRPGQQIIIPGASDNREYIEVNGYVFPNVEDEVLDKTLPNLTYVSIFSYQVKPDGNLTPINDDKIIEAAKKDRVAPMMVITNIKEEGDFDSDLVSTILNSVEVQDNLIKNVLEVLDKGYYGLNIDFEYIPQNDKDKYNDFLKKINDVLEPLGYFLITSLAPKTSAGQRGLLYEAHDYATHGSIVDRVILMTYEWGYSFGPARPVAPANLVEQVIKYAVTEIPSEKILMGIPNYGYDWTLPFVRGSVADTLTLNEAVELAKRVGAKIQFDNVAKSPFFRYTDENRRQHEVWFEDARSIEAKFEIVKKYNLAGVSYWTLNKFFAPNWVVLNSKFKITKVV